MRERLHLIGPQYIHPTGIDIILETSPEGPCQINCIIELFSTIKSIKGAGGIAQAV
jgi:hypothetical protein